MRENLKKAVRLLNEAGYDFVDGKMTNLATGEPLRFEVLSNSSNGAVFTRVMLPFIDNLKKIGIEMSFRVLEVNIFQNRLNEFDFDMAILAIAMKENGALHSDTVVATVMSNLGFFKAMEVPDPIQATKDLLQFNSMPELYLAKLEELAKPPTKTEVDITNDRLQALQTAQNPPQTQNVPQLPVSTPQDPNMGDTIPQNPQQPQPMM